MLNLEGFVGDSDGLYEIGKPKARGPLTRTRGGGGSRQMLMYTPTMFHDHYISPSVSLKINTTHVK